MLQDDFLKSIVQARVAVTIYLTNGIRLLGQVDSFDQYGIVLSGASQQFIYKHAISTVVPARDIAHTRQPAAAEPAEPQAIPQTTPTPTPTPTPSTTLRPRRKRSTGLSE